MRLAKRDKFAVSEQRHQEAEFDRLARDEALRRSAAQSALDPRDMAIESLHVRVKALEDAPGPEPLKEALEQLEAVQASIHERRPEPAPEQPPEAIADLFQSDRPYAEQAKALWKRYNELTNKIMLKVATDAEIRKHEKLQGELDWIKRHAFEGV